MINIRYAFQRTYVAKGNCSTGQLLISPVPFWLTLNLDLNKLTVNVCTFPAPTTSDAPDCDRPHLNLIVVSLLRIFFRIARQFSVRFISVQVRQPYLISLVSVLLAVVVLVEVVVVLVVVVVARVVVLGVVVVVVGISIVRLFPISG